MRSCSARRKPKRPREPFARGFLLEPWGCLLEYLRKYSNNVIKISALHKIGIEEISDYIKKLFEEEEINLDNEIIVTNIRQKNLIQQAIQNLSEAENTLLNNMPIDIIAIFINKMLENLGEITGDSPSEEIINEIFSKFCLGK